MIKRLICLMLALMLVVTVFSGCTDEETIIEGSTFEVGNSEVIVGETVTSTTSDSKTSVNKEFFNKNGDVEYSFNIEDIKMPKRKLKNKTITYFSWADLASDNKATSTLMKKEFGVTFKTIKATQATYWDTLATYISAGRSPDLVETPSWDYYPLPIVNNLLQPLDDILDLDNVLWEDVSQLNELLSWKGKHYYVVNDAPIGSFIYYNTKMFKQFGVDKTPKDYFREDNWTWDTLAEIAKKFVTYNPDGSVKTSGFTMGYQDLAYTTGVELISRENGVLKHNLAHPNITKLMNWIYANGKAGTNALVNIQDRTKAFANGEVAMMSYEYYTITDDRLKAMRKDIEWVMLPRMDKNSDYYTSVWILPNPCIPVGAKNVEGAALYIEFNKWKNLGWRQSLFLEGRTNAARKKYKIKDNSLAHYLSTEEREWTEEMLDAHEYKIITNIWSSWTYTLGIQTYPGVSAVTEGETWSSVFNQNKPKLDSLVNKYK